MKTSDFSYELPEELIAQTPAEPRDSSRLMVADARAGTIEHKIFRDIINYFRPGDALVLNETKVIPARLAGVREKSGSPAEILLLSRIDACRWETLVKPGRSLKPGDVCVFGGGRLRAFIADTIKETGGRVVRFEFDGVFENVLDELGQMPLPPYIREKLGDPGRYQTVYAKTEGSAAAPTAGLHFTRELLCAVRRAGVTIAPVLLHVGLGTFRPVKVRDIDSHVMHAEYYSVTPETANAVNGARKAGGRVFCVGTTCARTLETVSDEGGVIYPGSGMTRLFITPGYRFRATDALITNFHLPESTLLMLVSAFMGRKEALSAYREAAALKYRFYSFGDAMLIFGKGR